MWYAEQNDAEVVYVSVACAVPLGTTTYIGTKCGMQNRVMQRSYTSVWPMLCHGAHLHRNKVWYAEQSDAEVVYVSVACAVPLGTTTYIGTKCGMQNRMMQKSYTSVWPMLCH